MAYVPPCRRPDGGNASDALQMYGSPAAFGAYAAQAHAYAAQAHAASYHPEPFLTPAPPTKAINNRRAAPAARHHHQQDEGETPATYSEPFTQNNRRGAPAARHRDQQEEVEAPVTYAEPFLTPAPAGYAGKWAPSVGAYAPPAAERWGAQAASTSAGLVPKPSAPQPAPVQEAWEIELEPVDWASVRRSDFRRAFIEPQPRAEADAERKALGVVLEEAPTEGAPPPARSFEELEVLPSYALQALNECGITTPMPVQAQALPLVLSGHDVIGLAQTGSGKTLAFLLPAVVHMEAQAPLKHREVTPITLVLAPTRELAVQIAEEAGKVLKHSQQGKHRYGLGAVCIYGGGNKRDQIWKLGRGAHIVVATPGRLIDFIKTQVLSCFRTTYFVLDEADRMLDMGFHGDVTGISSQIRPERQTLFFSATWPRQVQVLARDLCHQGGTPARFSVGIRGSGGGGVGDGSEEEESSHKARATIVQEVVVIDCVGNWEEQEKQKKALLEAHLRKVLDESDDHKVLVFVSQKTLADEISRALWDEGFKADAMHGGKAQESRLWVLDQFRQGHLRLLIVTDVLSRGIDIPDVSHVVIHEMGAIEDYVHRIGRTARGMYGKGHALVFFEYNWKFPTLAADLIKVLEASSQEVPQSLQQLALEVEQGTREVFQPQSKWGGGGGWKSGSHWNNQSSDRPAWNRDQGQETKDRGGER